jgi:hypothetical protein
MVKGDLTMTGGTRIFGAAMVVNSLGTGTETVTGSARILYSSQALARIEGTSFKTTQSMVYYKN